MTDVQHHGILKVDLISSHTFYLKPRAGLFDTEGELGGGADCLMNEGCKRWSSEFCEDILPGP
jgi:hypothetical protein